VLIRGDYTGLGSASITSSSITISAQIADALGNPGTLTATVPMSNDRFAGTGTAMNLPINISGRMDPPDAQGSNGSTVTGPRLVATFTTGTGQVGRIVGGPVPGGS
jgi:hypothetical protein